MIGDRDKCIAAGMDEYVTKPLRVSNLIAAINSMKIGGSCSQNESHEGRV